MTTEKPRTVNEIAQKVSMLVGQGVKEPNMSALLKHVRLGCNRIFEQPVVVHSEGNDKSIVIFEHYKVEQDEHGGVKLSILNGRKDDAKGVFTPYSYTVDDFNNEFEEEFYEGVEIHESKETKWRTSRWIFDMPLESSKDHYNSFAYQGQLKKSRLRYTQLACIIKIAEYLDMLHLVDHNFLFSMTEKHKEEQEVFDCEYLGWLKMEFLDLYEKVYGYLEEKYFEKKYDLTNLSLKMGVEIEEHLKSMCSKDMVFLFDMLTEKNNRGGDKKNKQVLRISKIDYISKRFAPYMKSIKRLQQYSKAELYYLLRFQGKIEQFNNRNFFSYNNMVVNSLNGVSFKFRSIEEMESFNLMKIDVLRELFESDINYEMLEEWFVLSAIEQNKYKKVDEAISKRNYSAWRMLLEWLKYGDEHIKLTGAKQDQDKVLFIKNTMDYMHKMAGGKSANVFTNLDLAPETLAQAFDLSCKYIDHIGRGLIEAKGGEKELNEATEIYKQKLDIFTDFIRYYDGGCKQFLNLEWFKTNATMKSIENNIEDWLENRYGFYEDELEEAKDVVYKHLKADPIEHNGCVFTPFTNECQLMIDGIEMYHSVDSYKKQIKSRKYIMFSAQLEGERATLGLHFIKGGFAEFKFCECYKKYDEAVSNKMMKCVESFIEHLNDNRKLIMA